MKTSKILLLIVLTSALFVFSCGTQEIPKVNYAKGMRSAQRTANSTTLRMLNLKIEEFQTDKGRYPDTLEELKPYIGSISLKGEGGGKFSYDGESHEFKFDPEAQ